MEKHAVCTSATTIGQPSVAVIVSSVCLPAASLTAGSSPDVWPVHRGRESPEARDVLLPLAAHLAPFREEALTHRSFFMDFITELPD